MGPIRGIVKLVSGGIGLVSEGVEAHKQKKAQEKARSTDAGSDVAESSASAAARAAPPMEPIDGMPPEYVQVSDEHADQLIMAGKAIPVEREELEKKGMKNDHGSNEDDDDGDSDDSNSDIGNEAEWALDEAQERAMGPPPSYEESIERQDSASKKERLLTDVLRLAAPASQSARHIPYPVILPQRRPRDKGRGFVRAYAPVLESCSIPQDAFLKFLNNWEEASKADAYLNVIMVGAFAAGFVPDVWAQIATTIVQVGVGTAQELQRRHRSNSFLDQMNQQLFEPRGLYALVMTFKPENDKPVGFERVDVNETIARYNSQDAGRVKETLKGLRLSSGTSYGELMIPHAAPLVYPGVDDAAMGSDAKKQNALKSTGEFVADYLDRRAQAKYAYSHPGSTLSTTQPQHFASRFSDPNHAVNSGSIISLVTGGAYDPRARRQARREWKHQRKNNLRIARGRAPKNYRSLPRDQREPKGIRRILTESILYLTIVNLPSEKEIAEAKEKLAHMEREKKMNPGLSYGAQASGSR